MLLVLEGDGLGFSEYCANRLLKETRQTRYESLTPKLEALREMVKISLKHLSPKTSQMRTQ